MREKRLRVTEALLLLLALAVLVCGVGLSVLTKLVPPEPNTILLQTATAKQIAQGFGVPATVAEKIVTARSREGFSDVDAIARLRTGKTLLVPRETFTRNSDRFVVRSVADARAALLTWAGAMAAFFVAAHIVLRVAHPRTDPFLLPIAALLSFLSLLLLFALKDPLRDKLAFVAQAQGVVFGGAAALGLALSPMFGRAPLHRYGYVYALAAFAGCALLLVAGAGPGGVRLSVAGVQPVEAVKILLVFFLAAYLSERAALLDDPLRTWGIVPIPRAKDALPLLVMYALPLLLFAVVRDLGPALLLFGVFVTMLYLATGRVVYVWAGVALLLLGGTIFYKLGVGVFQTRLDMWLSPWNNRHGQGDHLALGLWGMASGGPLGSGWGLGGTRFIPRGGSDLAFASLGEETGIAGSVTVLLCFLIIVARGFAIARRAATDFDRYLAAGLSCLFGLQSLLIVSGTLGLFPLSGVTLPFLSFGKSSLIASLFAVGVLLHLSARTVPGASALVTLPRPWEKSARRVGLFFFITLGVVCTGRLLYIQGLAADALASRTVRVPDRDGVVRAHINPRLLALAAHIKRGAILDRRGTVLAMTNAAGRRVYPLGAATGHLVGYLSPAIGGPVGMERRYDATLRGYASYTALVPVWRTKNAPGFRLPQGKPVVLSLDAELQQAAADALGRASPGRGAAVVLDVSTGAILAAATVPAYDPNRLTPALLAKLNANKSGDFALINRAVAGYYPPGSTFKIVTASAQFDANQANFTTNCEHIAANLVWDANGETYARRRIGDDAGEAAHGLTNLSIAVSESCNVYFARAGIALGASSLHDHAARYGFAKLPTVAQFGTALPETAFGQGEMLATPLEMAGVAQAVANGGKRVQPTWRKGDAPTVSDTPLSPENAALLTQMMRRVTQTGTAAGRFDDLPFAVAGKTGTAQNNRYNKSPHSWFIGFAPGGGESPTSSESPRVAFAVIVENGGYGARAAVPVASAILKSLR